MARRVYIYEETYEKIMKFAEKEWERNKTRSPQGKPITKSFAFALSRFIEIKK